MPKPKSYAIVGTGARCRMFIDAIYGEYATYARLVGLCDTSRTRMAYYNRHIQQALGGQPVPEYPADRFADMVRETRPDTVIVVSMDCTHHTYIVQAMELGCDVVTEKPMTTDPAKAQQILDAVERTGRDCRVTFNYRYRPDASKVRELIMAGEIGTPTSVNFQWYLDTSHGADYFRRWHAEKDKSGGLLVHKSTHHFDLVNFWIASLPMTVFAMGELKFYGRANAEARGEHYPYARYTGEKAAENDPFALRLDAPGKDGKPSSLKEIYLDAEAETGYLRDRNVFGDHISIEDTIAVMARYHNGVILNYSLLAYCPWEGERAVINGTRGQVELFARGKGHVIRGQSDADLAREQYTGEKYVRLQRMFEPPIDVEVPEVKGGHGGADAGILERVFLPDELRPEDPLGRDSSHYDGAASLLMGFGANRSIETGQPVETDTLMKLGAKPLAASMA